MKMRAGGTHATRCNRDDAERVPPGEAESIQCSSAQGATCRQHMRCWKPSCASAGHTRHTSIMSGKNSCSCSQVSSQYSPATRHPSVSRIAHPNASRLPPLSIDDGSKQPPCTMEPPWGRGGKAKGCVRRQNGDWAEIPRSMGLSCGVDLRGMLLLSATTCRASGDTVCVAAAPWDNGRHAAHTRVEQVVRPRRVQVESFAIDSRVGPSAQAPIG